jgi:hypothetical protein
MVVHEVFTWTWLTELSERHGRPVTLADVPGEEWDRLRPPGVTAVWLMGVWERSPAGRAVALADPDVRAATLAALPHATDADVVGSAYCVRDYSVDDRLGGDAGLAAARRELAARGLRLLLDFVPNHVAPDHPWVGSHPEYFVHETPGGPIALARDPHFPPWRDVLQLDPMSPELRHAAVETLHSIAQRCDGVRCDMAMLALDEVAERTWGSLLAATRPEPYWVEVTRRVRDHHPNFLFLAEAYWNLEGRLVEQGFDLCYDKPLYDRLAHGDAQSIRAHVAADPAWQRRLVRFLENHDEPRAAVNFPPARNRAAAVVLLTLPGVPLLYHGQLEGRRIRPPVQLRRAPREAPDEELAGFWLRLLGLVADERLRDGEWQLLDVAGWPDNRSGERLLAWRWARHVVVVNFGDTPADGLVQLGPSLAGETWRLVDVLHDVAFERDGDDLATRGLYVRLGPWESHVLRLGRQD